MRRAGGSIALALGLGVLAHAGPADAYCRTTSCGGDQGQVCTPAADGDCGIPLFNHAPQVTYSIQKDASQKVSFEAIRGIVRTAFDAWMAADCGGGATPRLEVVEADPAECALHEYNKTLGNANIILFHDDVWPYDASKIAVTTVTFNAVTGEIYDADMELNSADEPFTTGDTGVMIDLLSVVTHESGHFLGLAHSASPDATMFFEYQPGTVTQRTLTGDDDEGICAIYPPGPISAVCDGAPRHGLSTLCAAEQTDHVEPPAPASDAAACCCPDGDTCVDNACVATGCCSVAPGSDAAGAGAPGLATLGGLLLAARRRGRARIAVRG